VAAKEQWQSHRFSIGRLGVRLTDTEWIAVTLLWQERLSQPTQQEANSRLRPAANCRHPKWKKSH